MTYRYLYQTKTNENREGTVKAANRAEAYALLRKEGIRPYRVIGDDPSPWRRRLVWIIPTGVAALAVLVAGLALAFAFTAPAVGPAPRGQLAGDAQFIAEAVANGWSDVFRTKLDRYLAAYAQPGWSIAPEAPGEEELAAFAAELETPLAREKGERAEVRAIRNIVAKMREEMKEYLASGGTVADYVEFLSERQERELALRSKAMEALERAPADMKRRAWANLNMRLADQGLAPLPPFSETNEAESADE